MTSNAMNGVMRDGGFMENSGEFNEIFDNSSMPNNMGINNQQTMPNSSQQKGHFSQQQGNGSTNQFMNNQFNQVSNLSINLTVHLRLTVKYYPKKQRFNLSLYLISASAFRKRR